MSIRYRVFVFSAFSIPFILSPGGVMAFIPIYPNALKLRAQTVQGLPTAVLRYHEVRPEPERNHLS